MVGKGQVVSMGTQLGTIYSEELMEVEVPLNDKKLQWIDITGKESPEVTVLSDFSGKKNVWKGQVKRMTAELQNKSRLPKLIIEVKKPYTTKNVPMLPNMFVKVVMSGKKLENAFKIPSRIVRDEKIYVVNDGVIEIRKVKIEGYLGDLAVVSEGLKSGEMVVTSVLRDVVNGMKVRSEAIK
jgi:multidrug efflux pump subunit AcrA (membrane-fusion protein)